MPYSLDVPPGPSRDLREYLIESSLVRETRHYLWPYWVGWDCIVARGSILSYIRSDKPRTTYASMISLHQLTSRAADRPISFSSSWGSSAWRSNRSFPKRLLVCNGVQYSVSSTLSRPCLFCSRPAYISSFLGGIEQRVYSERPSGLFAYDGLSSSDRKYIFFLFVWCYTGGYICILKGLLIWFRITVWRVTWHITSLG